MLDYVVSIVWIIVANQDYQNTGLDFDILILILRLR